MMTTCARFCYRSVAGRGAKRGSIARSQTGGREAAARATRIYVLADNLSSVRYYCVRYSVLYNNCLLYLIFFFCFVVLNLPKRIRPSISTFGTTARRTNDYRRQTTRFHIVAGSSSPRHAVLRSRVHSNISSLDGDPSSLVRRRSAFSIRYRYFNRFKIVFHNSVFW